MASNAEKPTTLSALAQLVLFSLVLFSLICRREAR